jgi:hypothetical protein
VSPFIAQIIAWLRSNGVKVHERAYELPCYGMYRSETKEIFLNVADATLALLTLAHEAGHWLGYLIDAKENSYQRERQAFAYGWHVLQWFEAPISRKLWIEAELSRRERRLEGTPKITHLFRTTRSMYPSDDEIEI